MLRRPESTPCPSASFLTDPQAARSLRDSILSNGGDSTANIDFTTDFRASMRNVAPRRRQSGVGIAPNRRNARVTFSIHEDEEVKAFPRLNDKPKSPLRSSVLAQPAQRFKPRVSFIAPPTAQQGASTQASYSMSHTSAPAVSHERRVPQPETTKESKSATGQGIKKPARRGTLYIPSEDTTVPSIFMGVFSPIKNVQMNESTDHTISSQIEMTGIAAQMAQKKGSRKSLATEPPKRGPLQIPLRQVQGSTSASDIHGQGFEKENVPPGWRDAETKDKEEQEEKDLFDVMKPLKTSRMSINPANVRRRSFIPPEQRVDIEAQINMQSQQTRRTSIRGPLLPNGLQAEPAQTLRRTGPRRSTVLHANIPIHAETVTTRSGIETSKANLPGRHRQTIFQYPTGQLPPIIQPKPERIPERVLLPLVEQPSLAQQYPLLKEDILEPSLYENNWLAHQEVAITQLVNNLFFSAKGSEAFTDYVSLRSDILRLYQDPSTALLQKRIQAALLYGALSIPKEVLAKGSRLVEDLGLKRKFLDLWTTTYDLSLLQAAAESIFGRECSYAPQKWWSGGVEIKQRKPSKRSIEQFLEVFLLRNEDIRSDDSTGWSYQRTVLRSLLLILLLDQARTSSKVHVKICLFQPTSQYKSSQSVLEGLAAMILPFAGDVIRPLSHLNYSLDHVQYPLEEYEYSIGNLAIDLRDGVRLTRLVELLLYPSASHVLGASSDSGITTTVAMPTGEILALTEGEHDWPLSQHLKFPCIGRATKIFNVQVALSALAGVRGVVDVVNTVKAEDVVDGFREKTVALLWALVSKWGLGSLIDWKDVQTEIRRLENRSLDQEESDHYSDDEDEEVLSLGKQKQLLKRWASANGARKGLRVNNMTTDFADGQVFSAIIDEYTPYLQVRHGGFSSNASLGEKLTAIGCSSQFGKPPLHQNRSR